MTHRLALSSCASLVLWYRQVCHPPDLRALPREARLRVAHGGLGYRAHLVRQYPRLELCDGVQSTLKDMLNMQYTEPEAATHLPLRLEMAKSQFGYTIEKSNYRTALLRHVQEVSKMSRENSEKSRFL